jgi:hypothetical protein
VEGLRLRDGGGDDAEAREGFGHGEWGGKRECSAVVFR